jgi:hypothetical protein
LQSVSEILVQPQQQALLLHNAKYSPL